MGAGSSIPRRRRGVPESRQERVATYRDLVSLGLWVTGDGGQTHGLGDRWAAAL